MPVVVTCCCEGLLYVFLNRWEESTAKAKIRVSLKWVLHEGILRVPMCTETTLPTVLSWAQEDNFKWGAEIKLKLP